MRAPVQLVFRGEIVPGFALHDVQRELGRLLKLDETKLARLFSGQRTVLKRDLAEADAQRYLQRLQALGARVHLEPMPVAAPSPSAPVARVAVPAGATDSGFPTIVPPEDTPAPPPPRPAPPPPPLALATQAIAAAAEASKPATSDWQLATEAAEQEQITCPNCGETQSKRVLCRQCATNMPMGIAAKLEEEARRREERQAALEARRAQRGGSADSSDDSPWAVGFGFSGRVGRLRAASGNTWLLTAMLLLTIGFLQRPSLPRMLLLGVGVLAVFFFSMRLTVLRCHDCDRHGWWALFVLVPYAGSVASLLFALVPGNKQVNEYGPPPPKGSWGWLVVAVLAFLLTSVALAKVTWNFIHREIMAEQSEDEADDDDAPVLVRGSFGTPDIDDAFHRDYVPAPGHKAFAVSTKKAYGWASGAASPQDAARAAWAQCQQRREPYTADCRIVNIDGQWVR